MSAVFKYRWVAVPVLVTSATIVTAALIGDRSAVDYGGGLDYLTRPIPIRWPISAALVVVSVFAYAASTTYFLRSVPDGEARDPWARAWLLLTTAGLVLGIVYRVVTAGVIGVNIGGGFAFWVATPLSAYLVLRAGRIVQAAGRSHEPEPPAVPS